MASPTGGNRRSKNLGGNVQGRIRGGGGRGGEAKGGNSSAPYFQRSMPSTKIEKPPLALTYDRTEKVLGGGRRAFDSNPHAKDELTERVASCQSKKRLKLN